VVSREKDVDGRRKSGHDEGAGAGAAAVLESFAPLSS
jgi:hypothetical protein